MADTKRYAVEWVDADEVVRTCERRGMKANDDRSYWDFTSPEYHEKSRMFPNFGTAFAFALEVVAKDVFGCARLYRENLVHQRDDLGNVFLETVWEKDAGWDVFAGSKLTELSDPDFTYD